MPSPTHTPAFWHAAGGAQLYAVPAHTPPAVVAKIDADLQKALAMPDVREALTKQGMEVLTSTPEQLGRRMRSEAERWGQLVKAAGIKAE